MAKKEKTEKNEENILAKKVHFMSNFRNNLYKLMKERNISRAELSEISGLSDGTIQTVLYGKGEDCKLSTAIALAKAFGVSIDELADAGILEDTVKQNMIAIRSMPENAKYIIRWFINHQAMLYREDKRDGQKRISVIDPIYTNDGVLKVTNRFRQLDISELPQDVQDKVFIGLRLSCEFYMPYYSPFDVVLLANDRAAFPREHVVILKGNNIFFAKQKFENGHYNYYGIRDGKFRCDESNVDEVVGYVTYVVPDTTEDGER